ncbi:MAG: hypothetical protein ABIG55_04040 [Candidatus Omnitrophota bacterium]
MEKKRLVGLTVLGVISLLIGTVGIVSVVMGVNMKFFPHFDPAKGYELDIQMGEFLFVFGTIVSLFLPVGIYTLKQKRVSRILNFIISPVTGSVLATPFIIIFGNVSAYLFSPVGILLVIYYLTRSKVKGQLT